MVMGMIKRPLPIIGGSYLLSLAAVFGLGLSADGYVWLAAIVCITVCAVCLIRRPSRNVLRVVLLSAAAFAVGTAWSAWRTMGLPAQLSAVYGQKALISARYEDFDGQRGSRYDYIVRTSSVRLYNPRAERYEPVGVPQRVTMRLTATAPLDAAYGDTITAEVSITPPYPLAGEKRMAVHNADGVYAFCYAYGELAYQTPEHTPLMARLRAFRDRVEAGIQKAVGGEAGRICAAMLTGNKREVSGELLGSFRAAGLSHLLAVSGLHASILTQFLLLLLAFFRVSPRVSGVVSGGLILLFMAFAGFTPSVVRAGVMACALFAAQLFRRRYDGINSVSLAALIICGVNPAAFISAGFLLSFSATLSIILLTPALCGLCERYAPKLWLHAKAVVQTAAVSLSATLFTYPFTAALFGRVSLIGPVANLLILPLVPLWMVFILLTGLFSLFGGGFVLTRACGFAARTLALIVTRAARFFGGLDFADAKAGVFIVFAVAALAVVCAAVARLLRKQKNPAVLAGISVFLLSAGLAFEALSVGQGRVLISFPDAASMTAVITQDGQAAVLAGVDDKKTAGTAALHLARRGFEEVEWVLAPCLNEASATAVARVLEETAVQNLAIADDTFRYRELLSSHGAGGLIEGGRITSYRLLSGVTALVDRRQEGKPALCLEVHGAKVLFLYGGTDAARLPEDFLAPDVCIISGAVPKNIEKVRSSAFQLTEPMRNRQTALFADKAVLIAPKYTAATLTVEADGTIRWRQ